MTKGELTKIKEKVYQHCGLLLEGVAEERLRKAIQDEIQKNECANLTAYQKLISQDSQAFDQLINHLTVNETYFFREVEQIQLLVEHLVPQILANKSPNEPLRILSAGCSSGEEPYSLAIALREALGAEVAQRIQLDAGDLDQNVLKKAQQGLYSEFSFRGVDPAIRRRYFLRKDKGYQLIPEIRQRVRFHELNLLAPVFPKRFYDYDIIFFRNVSIYFDLETRRIIQKKFYELMPAAGILILGSSETLGNNLGVFELVEQHNQYYFVKGQSYRPNNNSASLELEPEPAAVTPAELPVFESPVLTEQETAPSPKLILPELQTLQQLVKDKDYTRALHLLDRLLMQEPDNFPALLLKSWVLLNNQDFLAADELLNKAFELDAWSIDLLLMKGLSAKWQEDQDLAAQWFKKVVYTSPDCWPAHYYLADIYRHQQRLEAASKAYQTLVRILTANLNAADATQWIPLALPAGDLLFLSQRHLQKLTADLYEREK
ncbi:CheR family methyltransferase [Marinospirillum insulare]|uniref:Protein-glutamate O-methyltransferase n=1 Tax=Marinospirillum insulare TaxID=217169 RepID=A0ABQ6A062_9GAMM|nr:protein-glutamate O-methyltransferase CheR [Marinospirillum insulare]GLR65186.1 protein-glutamate O-methyltransferase [Marinospirillum insulare]